MSDKDIGTTLKHLCMGCMRNKGPVKTCPHCHWEESGPLQYLHHLPLRTVLNNRFLIGRVLSEGKFSITYLAYNLRTRQKLIIKEFYPRDIARRNVGNPNLALADLKHESDFNFGLGKFIEEGMALEKIKYLPGLARGQGSVRANGTAYQLTEFIEGPHLQEYLAGKGGQVSFHHLVRILTPVMVALEKAHEHHVLHHDIYPENIIVGRDGLGTLVDFTATRFELAQKWNILSSLSRPGYSPPEFYSKAPQVGPWSDIYSLAATMFFALSGQAPTAAAERLRKKPLPPPHEFGADVTGETETVLLKALSLNPRERFQTMKAFKESILESWYAWERKKPSSAVEAFSRAKCPYCGVVNEVLRTDLETGTTTCFACHHPLVADDGTILPAPSAEPVSPAPRPVEPEAVPAVKVRIKQAPSRKAEAITSAKEAFTLVPCLACGVKNEVLISDLGTIALCVECGARLPAPSPSPAPAPAPPSPAPPELSPEIPVAEAPPPAAISPEIIQESARAEAPEQIAAPPENLVEISEGVYDHPRDAGSETAPPPAAVEEAPAAGREAKERITRAEEPQRSPGEAIAEPGPAAPPAPAKPKPQPHAGPLTPLDCPECRSRNYFTIEEILGGVTCEKCGYRFFSQPAEEKKSMDGIRRERLREKRRQGRKLMLTWVSIIVGAVMLTGGILAYRFIQEDRTESRAYRHYIEQADRLFEEGNYPEALGNYRSALVLEPEEPYLIAQIRECERLLLEFEKKADEQKQQNLLSGQLNRADSLFAAGDLEAARLAYEAALLASPEDPYILSRLGEINKPAAAPPRAAATSPGRISVPSGANLQATIDRAAPSSVIHLGEGIFTLPKPLRISKSLELRGAGPNHTLIISSAGEAVLLIQDAGELSVANIGFEHQGEAWADVLRVRNSAANFNNCMFKGGVYNQEQRSGGSGLVFEGNSRGKVQNSRFNGNYIAVNARQRSQPLLSGNEIWGNHIGVQISENARPVLKSNRIRENFNNGIAILDQAQPEIEANQVIDNKANGLFFYGAKFNGTIRNNQVLNNRDLGILLTNESQPTIEDNKIQWNGMGGIQYNDRASGIVRYNVIQANKSGGVKITNSSHPTLKENIIKGNHGDGIEISDKAAPTVDGNEIIQNNGDGISLLLSSPGGFVRNNICKGNQGYGISILKPARPTLINNQLQGNYEGVLYEETAAAN